MPHLLAGIWEMIRAELAGADAPDLLALHVQLELTADTYTVRFAGQIADHGTFTLAANTLTITGTAGPNAGRTIPCLYELAGDELRICYGLDGTPPAALATAPDTQLYLATYRRKSP